MRDPFAALRAELLRSDPPATGRVRMDVDRLRRTGIPEVIFGECKDDDLLVEACSQALQDSQRVIVSRVAPDRAERIAARVRPKPQVDFPYGASTAVFAYSDAIPPRSGGRVAILTAGSSDLLVAGEAATIASELGCMVEIVSDVGVAGLHRLVRPLSAVIQNGANVIVVAAGMDGALPSVVAGLVDVPVIGVPTSTGYGVAAGGHAALLNMLATCAPGLTVVNIDNGIGAGAAAARIANRARRPSSG
jgi:NCAIR mutase (PurE)-related protein